MTKIDKWNTAIKNESKGDKKVTLQCKIWQTLTLADHEDQLQQWCHVFMYPLYDLMKMEIYLCDLPMANL